MKIKFTVDICEGCSAFTNYPSCYNCPYFNDHIREVECEEDEIVFPGEEDEIKNPLN